MTTIKGKPVGFPPGTLKMVIREEIPYRTVGLGVSPGLYQGTWNSNTQQWDVGNVLMPRRMQPDAVPLAGVSIFISDGSGAIVAKYEFSPQQWIETADGVFDLSAAPVAHAWIRTQELTELASAAQAATKAAKEAATLATDAAAKAGTSGGTGTGGNTGTPVAVQNNGGTSVQRPVTPALYEQFYDTVLNKLLVCVGMDSNNRAIWRTAAGDLVAWVAPLGTSSWEYFRWVFPEARGKSTGVARVQYGVGTKWISPAETPVIAGAGPYDWPPNPAYFYSDALGYAWQAKNEITITTHLAQPQTLSGYKFYVTTNPFPTVWRFEASQNGVDWTVLDSVTDFPAPVADTWVERTF